MLLQLQISNCAQPYLLWDGAGRFKPMVALIQGTKMKVKNISGERLIEPYFNIVLEPNDVIELQEPQLSRVLVSYPGKVQLVLEEEQAEEIKEKPKRGRPAKTQEVVSEETSE